MEINLVQRNFFDEPLRVRFSAISGSTFLLADVQI